jgi:N-acetylneuraminate synthase
VTYDIEGSERANIVFRRSLYAVRAIRKGEAFTKANVRSIRPGFGLAPRNLPRVLSHRASRDVAYGEPIAEDMLG